MLEHNKIKVQKVRRFEKDPQEEFVKSLKAIKMPKRIQKENFEQGDLVSNNYENLSFNEIPVEVKG